MKEYNENSCYTKENLISSIKGFFNPFSKKFIKKQEDKPRDANTIREIEANTSNLTKVELT